MKTERSVDIAALVGEMEAPPCESRGHLSDPPHDDGPATHYVRISCKSCGSNVIKSYCSTFIDHILTNPMVDCADCDAIVRAGACITIIGPVKS